MGFNLDEIKLALKQPKSYIWDSYTSSKPSASNLVGKSDVAFGNTPQYSAAPTADDFWRQSLESDSNYYESQGYTFDGTKWVSPNEWFKGNKTYWENQAKNAYSQLNSDQRGLIDKDGNGSFSLEEIRDYQRANGLVADGKLGKNTMARLNIPSGEKTYNAGLLRTVAIPSTPTSSAPTSPLWDEKVVKGLMAHGGRPVKLSDGTIAYKLNGNFYYSNGRMKSANGMSNYDQKVVSRLSNENYVVPYAKQNKPNFTDSERDRVNRELAELLNNTRFRKSHVINGPAYINGRYMPIVVTQGSLGGNHNDQSFAYDSRSQHFIPLLEKWTGQTNGEPMLDDQGRMFYYSQDAILNNRMVQGHSYKNGGSLNKYQQGGTMNNEQELQKAFMAFLIEDASTQGITIQSEEDLVKYAESLGEDGIKAKYQEFMQKMQGGVKAKLGAKLNYIRKIKGLCADDEELVYLKQGGRVCPVCQKKMEKAQEGTKVKKNAVEEFKKSRKLHVNPDDTVHVKPGVPRSLFNSDGTAIDKRFPVYSKKEYQKDLKTEDGRKRALKLDIRASKCGGKVKK